MRVRGVVLPGLADQLGGHAARVVARGEVGQRLAVQDVKGLALEVRVCRKPGRAERNARARTQPRVSHGGGEAPQASAGRGGTHSSARSAKSCARRASASSLLRRSGPPPTVSVRCGGGAGSAGAIAAGGGGGEGGSHFACPRVRSNRTALEPETGGVPPPPLFACWTSRTPSLRLTRGGAGKIPWGLGCGGHLYPFEGAQAASENSCVSDVLACTSRRLPPLAAAGSHTGRGEARGWEEHARFERRREMSGCEPGHEGGGFWSPSQQRSRSRAGGISRHEEIERILRSDGSRRLRPTSARMRMVPGQGHTAMGCGCHGIGQELNPRAADN